MPDQNDPFASIATADASGSSDPFASIAQSDQPKQDAAPVYSTGVSGPPVGMGSSGPQSPIAGAGSMGLRQPADHAPVEMNQVQTLTGAPAPGSPAYARLSHHIEAEQGIEANEGIQAAQDVSGVSGMRTAASGAYDIGRGVALEHAASGGNPFANGGKSSSSQALALQQGGAKKLVGGGASAALTLDAPDILGTLGSAARGDLQAQVQAAKIILGFGAGTAAAGVAGKVADKYQFTPEAKDLMVTGAFFFPSLVGAGLAKAGVTKSGFGADPEGNPAYVAGAPGVKAGVVQSPEAYDIRAKVGDTTLGVRIPRQPSAADVTAKNILDSNVQTMQDAAKTDAAAQLIVQGATPEQAVAAQQPKAPPTPQQQAAAEVFPNPVIPQERIAQAATIVKSLPPEEQGPALLEAHKNLAAQIGTWQTFVGPDGKTYTVRNPQDAEKYASQFINAEVDRHEKAAADAQKQAETAQAEQQKPAAGKSKLQQAANEKLYQRAKTLLDSTELQAGQPPEPLVQRNLGVSPEQAAELVKRYQGEQLPTVGSKDEPVVEESKATVDAQMEALKRGDIRVVHIPDGSSYLPEQPKGIQKVTTPSSDPGAGTFFFKPGKGLRKETIVAASKAGTHGDLLGHIQTKEDIANAPQGTVAVVAQKPDGTEIQASEVDATKPEIAQQQAQILQERHPEAQVVIKPTDAVIEKRLDAQDPFAGITENVEPTPQAKGGSGEPAPGGTEQPKAAEANQPTAVEQIPGHDGNKTELNVRDEKHPATYRLVEAEHVQASHDPLTFAENPKHPGNQRDYQKKDAKGRVINQAQNLDPSYLVTDNPDAVNGPPIIEPDGAADGGNSRAMTIQRAYKLHPEQAEKYKTVLRSRAAAFGFTPEQVDGLKQPMLVRQIAASESAKHREAMVGALNETKTAELTPGEEAVSNGRKLTPEIMDEISRLIDSSGDGASIRDMLREHGGQAIKLFETSGIITEQERPKYVDDGNPSEAGKDLIENAILGHVVDDAKLMDAAPKSTLRRLDGSLAAIAHIGAENDEYNLIPVIRDALDQHAEVSKRKTTVELFQGQGGLLEQRDINPVVDAISRKLTAKPTEVKRTLKAFAADAKDGRLGQGSLMGPPPTPVDAFNQAFGTKLTEKEYADGIARGVSEEEPRAAESRAAQGDSSVHAGGSSQPEAKGQGSVDRADGGQHERKYKFGNTQHNLDPNSPAAKAIDAIRARIDPADLAGQGVDIDENHVTVRYGIQSEDTAGIRKFIQAQAPFDAKLGKTASFPPTKNSDGAAVLIAPVESPELHRLNADIAKHGDFKESDFPDYKPHVTVAYLKPEAIGKYVGQADAEGKAFKVDSISISDRDGGKDEVKLEGKPTEVAAKEPESNSSKISNSSKEPYTPAKGDRIRYTDREGKERTGVLKQETPLGVRVAPDGGGKPDFISKKKILGPAEPAEKKPLGDIIIRDLASGQETRLKTEEKPAPPAEETKPKSDYLRVADMGENVELRMVKMNDGRIGVLLWDKDAEASPMGTRIFLSKEAADSYFDKEAAAANRPSMGKTLADHLHGKITGGMMPKDNNALRAIVSEFDGKPADPARMKEAQEAMEEALVRRAREIVEGAKGNQHLAFTALVKLYESQPNLNIRTTTSIENQAYSTPAPLAFVASKLAGIDGKTTVYEPTAGNGMLLIGADPRNVHANELNPARVAALKAQKFKVTEGDALKADIKPKSMDAVITNPPFGSLKGADGKTRKESLDGYKIGQIDHLIAARALDAMKDDGRATMILGADKVAGGLNTDARIFLNWLYSHYNVASHFEVDGDLYARQGAGWPVRVINIDGRIRSDRFAPEEGTIQRAKTWKEVYERLESGLGAHAERGVSPRPGGPVSRPADDKAEVSGKHEEPTAKPDRQRPGSGQAPAERVRREQPRPVPDSGIESAPGLAATDSDVRPDTDVAQSDRLPEGESGKAPAERTAKPRKSGGSDLADPENAFQTKYTPASRKKDEGVLIPSNMRAPWEHAMRTLEDAVGDLDEFVRKQLGYKTLDDVDNAFMGLQVDSIAAAIHQMSRGKAIIIADQTGIGKGRQAAGIIRWAVKQGKIPVFMTVKPQLFTDMYGDLADIGTDDVAPFIMNSDEAVVLPDGSKAFANRPGQHKRTLEKIIASGELPEGRNAVFLTYSQINTANTQRDVLRALSSKAVFVLDESHNAAGESSTGEYVQEILQQAAGVTYLSATYAKRPDNMPLYFKTDMGDAIQDRAKLEDAMAQGGLPLQTVISNNLVKSGQLPRRERSYDGVDIITKVDKSRSAEHIKLADSVTQALRAVVKADQVFHHVFVKKMQEDAKRTGQALSGGGNQAAATIAHSEFTSVVHNFVKQMLLGLKADAAADEAIASLKAGEKPLIAVENTMGSFLQEYAANHGIGQGDALGKFGYRTVLSRALDRTRYVVHVDKQGNKTKQYIPLGKLDDETLYAYRKAQKIIDALEMDIAVSPIDRIRKRLTDAGHTVSEITGRDLAVDYSEAGKPALSAVPTEEREDKVGTTRKFNDGRLDAIILNVSGSTGISLHASEKFTDQRKRHMIVAQAAGDINVFMQMLGRIHRTGQVKLPRYTILNVDLPAEKRPTALLSKKMKSLNANTSSNTESATSVKAADILNKYGDEIVAQYLLDNPELARTLNVDPGHADTPTPDIARAATGRLAITPVKTQDAFYRDVEAAYNTYIQYLNDTNQNDLEPRTFDYDAKEEKTSVIFKGENPKSPFGEDAIYGEYSIKAQSKPLTPAEVETSIKEALGGRTPQQHTADLLAKLEDQWKASDSSEAQKAAAGMVVQKAKDFIQSHPIGTSLGIGIKGDDFLATVVDIEHTHKGSGNPYSLSKFNVTLATNGSTPRMKVPATKLDKLEQFRSYMTPAQIFKDVNPNRREIAKVITGNLLGAYGELKDARGTIINFTKADGSVEQGILLPKKFDLKENTVGDYRMKTAAHILRFLEEAKGDEGMLMGVAARDGSVRATWKNGRLVISTHKSKARGAKYFLDPVLTKITGDFISSGQMMRVVVPAGKETAALNALMQKTALYVPRSMAELAEKLESKKSGGSTTMHASVFGLDILAKYTKVAWDKDIAPHLPAIASNLKEAAATVTHLLVPTAGANPDVLDAMMRLKGDQAKQQFALEQVFKGMAKMFDGLPEESRIDFMDRYKRGEDQETPELDKLATLYKATDTATYKRIVDAQVGGMDKAIRRQWDKMTAAAKEDFFDGLMDGREFATEDDRKAAADGDRAAQYNVRLQKIADGSLAFKEDHFRAFWKVIPGTQEERSVPRGKKAPLRGDRGFTKRSTLPDVTTGLEAGGVLVTSNPQKMFEMAQSSSLRYITALNMWKELGDLGMRKFVRFGEFAPEGWEKINDSISKVYFPAESGEGAIQAGEWYVEQSAARLLNNYLSKNWFQTNALGRGLMAVKNLSTAVELSLSPFHLVFESLEAVGSQFGLGLMHAWNQGLGKGDLKGFMEGAKAIGTSPAAPFLLSRTGGSALRATADLKAFAATPRGKAFLKSFPDAPHLIDLAFTGGLTMGMPADYRVNLMESAHAAMKDGNYLGAAVRAVPGIIQSVMNPLFEVYIPRLKMGFFLQAMSQQLAEQHDALMRGEVSEAEIARKVVNSVENRFGELNFSNLWWNNTFKGAMQLVFRSVTWKLGNWRGLTTGVAGQAKAFADPLKTMYDDARGNRAGADRKASDYVPKLDLNMSWLIGMGVTTAILGTIITKLNTGRYPWEFLGEDSDNGLSESAAILREIMHPRTGGYDEYSGKPVRLSLPTGMKDFEHAAEDPRGYLRSSESGFTSKMLDTWENRDFLNNYVYDPNGTAYQKAASILTYNTPKPISLDNYLRDKQKQDFTRSKLGVAGLTVAPRDLDYTPLEKHLEAVQKSKHIPETPEERDAYEEKMAAIRDGSITGKAKVEAMRQARKPFVRRMFDKLSYIEAKRAYDLANEEEQRELRGRLALKRYNALRKNPGIAQEEQAAE